MSQTRRLVAILAADVVGYSRLIGADEGGTLQAFKTIRAEAVDQRLPHMPAGWSRRRVTVCLLRFGRVVDAPRQATEVKTRLGERNPPGVSGLDRPQGPERA